MILAFAEETVDFVRHLENQVLKEIPGTVTLECELTKPNVKVQWLRGKTPVTKSEKYTIEADGTVHRLIIRDATGEDVSDYTAVARSKTSNCKLSVEGKKTLL